MAFSPTMKQLLRSIRSNKKQLERRDFIGESLHLAKPTDNQNTHLEAGHSSHHSSNTGEITEQEQPFQLETKGSTNASTTNNEVTRDNKLSFESQEIFNVPSSTRLEDPITDNRHEQNTFGPRVTQPIQSYKQQGYYARTIQNDPNESPNESPNEYNNQEQFEQKPNPEIASSFFLRKEQINA